MTPTTSRPFSRASAEVVDVEDRDCRRGPPSSSLSASVEDDGARDARASTPSALVEVALQRPGRCPAWTALGVKSRSSVAAWLGRSSESRAQPAAASAAARASATRSGSGPSAAQHCSRRARAGAAAPVGSSGCAAASPSRATSRSRCRGRAVLLQVLRVRDAPAAPARARRGRARCSTTPRAGSVKELLVLTGEAPDDHPGVRERLRRARASRTSSPTSCGPASGRSSAGCCRTPTSACSSRDDLARLREVTASQGLMLESVNPDLVAHQGSPTKHPARRLETIRAAGELRIPFTSGILVGIGESEEERDRRAARRWPRCTPSTATCRRSSSRTSSRTAATTARSRPRSRPRRPSELLAHGARPTRPQPRPARRGRRRSTIDDMKRLVAEARRLMPDVGIQIPPNLADWWPRARRARARPTSAA